MPFDPLPNLTQEQRNCLALADFIEESPDERFDMGDYAIPDCNTAGCIAGAAGALFKLPSYKVEGMRGRQVVSTDAANALGLTALQRLKMFTPWVCGGPTANEIDKHRAARVLRHFTYTGEVDWSV